MSDEESLINYVVSYQCKNSSNGRDSVYVTWRGVPNRSDQKSLIGYVVNHQSSHGRDSVYVA